MSSSRTCSARSSYSPSSIPSPGAGVPAAPSLSPAVLQASPHSLTGLFGLQPWEHPRLMRLSDMHGVAEAHVEVSRRSSVPICTSAQDGG